MQGIEIIGYDENTGPYPMHSFDDKGNTTLSQLRQNDDSTWTITAESGRATIKFETNCEVFTALWERKVDGARWEPWMDVTLTKEMKRPIVTK